MPKKEEAKDVLARYKNLVWPEIEKYFDGLVYPKAFQVPTKYAKDNALHWEIATTYPRRQGKYLRPTLLMLTAEAMGVKAKDVVKTAAAMQLSEDWLLIHDDIEDDSNVRRGLPALHRLYGAEHAINAGDAVHIIMWKVLVDNFQMLDSKISLAILDEFHRMLTRTIVGQGIEISWAKSKKGDFTNNDWFFIADGKTCYYTIAGPMRLGAIIAGASRDQLETLARFGQILGRCFQLVDDILDLVSKDYKGAGQAMGNDIYENKKTVMLGHLLRSANKKDKSKLLAILAKPRDKKAAKEVAWVIQKMREYGSIEYGRKLAADLKDKALEIFEKDLRFLARQPARGKIETLIHFILERDH